MTRTKTWQLMPLDHGLYCGMVAKLLPTLKWRHNGLGLLQAYVHESYPSASLDGSTCELRVHLWHKSLMRPGIEDSGLLHDHRFDLTSYVLVGQMQNIEYELSGHPEGEWVTHRVVPARKALASSGTNDGLVEELPGRFNVTTKPVRIQAGEGYAFPRFQFHGTHTESDLVVTLVQKTNRVEAQAKILAPFAKPVVHAFADPYPDSAWAPVIEQARNMLIDTWRRAV